MATLVTDTSSWFKQRLAPNNGKILSKPMVAQFIDGQIGIHPSTSSTSLPCWATWSYTRCKIFGKQFIKIHSLILCYHNGNSCIKISHQFMQNKSYESLKLQSPHGFIGKNVHEVITMGFLSWNHTVVRSCRRSNGIPISITTLTCNVKSICCVRLYLRSMKILFLAHPNC